MFSLFRQDTDLAHNEHRPYDSLIWLLLLAALLLRIVLAPIWTGYDTDISTFLAWSDRAYTVGLSGLYANAQDYFLDYPPGYMYVLYVIGLAHHLFSIPWESAASLLILKLPAMVSDIAIAYFVYRITLNLRGKRSSRLKACGMAALVAFNPAFWINSAIWGQVDSFFMMFILATFLLQQKGRLAQASACMALAILLKPQALLFGPFLLIDVLRKRDWKTFAICVLSGAATVFVLAFPFALGQGGYGWLFDLYVRTLSSYPYASLNAFNLMALLGGNFIEMTAGVSHMTYQMLGTVLLAAAVIFSCALYVRSQGRPGALFYIAFLFIAAVFICTTKMHERYLHYGLLPAFMAYLYIKDRRILWLFLGFSLTHAVNVGDVLLRSFHQHYHIPRYDALMLSVSAINVGLLVYACYVGWRLFVTRIAERQIEPETDASHASLADVSPSAASEGTINSIRQSVRWTEMFRPAEEGAQQSRKERLFKRKDAWYLLALIVVYTMIALYHLGGHTDPTTFWKPAKSGEAIVADLGEEHTITRINSFAGAGEGEYTYWFSADGVKWEHPLKVKSDHTKVFTWNTVEPKLGARYVKITADTSGFYLHEVGIYGEGNPALLPIRQVAEQEVSPNDQGKAAYVFDEPETIPYTPTYMEGSYFDEIYHARTAYEHLHRIEPYESTHPPLGKILISAGIWLFGLNPFGWRIVGTLFGVAMIPVMYLFAKRLFGRSEFAFIAAFLFTFDFMHFAQTRIATIDVYGVFFIMLMFYFMYRYTALSFYREGLWKTLVPLGLSGLFFGIGAASKWIVIYGGAGLALLLLLTLLERFGEYRFARSVLREDAESSWELADGAEEVKRAESGSYDVKHAESGAHEAEPVSIPEATGLYEAEAGGPVPAHPAVNASSDATPASASAALNKAAAEPVLLEPLTEDERSRLQLVIRTFPRHTLLTLAWCLLTFVVIPLVIYTLSYIPFMMVPGPGHGLKDVVTYQKHMYEYHKNLVATHPFSSPWWEWPLMLRPIWYYQGKLVPEGWLSSIVSFGNPLVWWPGFIAVVFSFFAAFRRKDKKLRLLLIAYCSQYLPWMLVPRLTFIYHYFAMVPFLVLMLTYYIKDFMEEAPDKRKWVYTYLGAVLVLFILFYPILSGMLIPKWYSQLLRWLPGWNFF